MGGLPKPTTLPSVKEKKKNRDRRDTETPTTNVRLGEGQGRGCKKNGQGWEQWQRAVDIPRCGKGKKKP